MKEDFFITGTALNNSIFPISLFIFFRVTKQLGIRARTVSKKMWYCNGNQVRHVYRGSWLGKQVKPKIAHLFTKNYVLLKVN